MTPRELIIVGGPNGAGKSTFALKEQSLYGGSYLSADAIAAELSPGNPSQAAMAAGRAFLLRFVELIHAEERLIVESTLAGRLLSRMIEAAKKDGWRIRIKFVFVDSADTSVNRVQIRASLGGHSVPEADIRRRFGRSIANFWTRYRLLADDWLLVYNQYWNPEQVASGCGEERLVYNESLYAQFLQLVKAHSS